MQKKWNVMVVPDSPGRKIFSFNLSSKTIWAVGGVTAAIFIIAMIVMGYAAHQWKGDKSAQISSLEGELDRRETEFSKLREEFSILEQLEDKLRAMAGLKPRRQEGSETASGGQGGSSWEVIGGGPSGDEDSPVRRANIKTPMELLEGSIELKVSFEEISDVFERESKRLSHIPSINPVASQDAWISSGYGNRKDPINGNKRFHEGSDIVAPRKTPIISPAAGIVKFAGWREGLGRAVEIEHGYGYVTTYGHCDKLFAKKGDSVKRGDLIAHVGSSGRSTGPHLHYEVRLHGKLVNPYKYVVQ
jgi:murein DD-endopeptidase MepM/ murein hydrolase activator NlpD